MAKTTAPKWSFISKYNLKAENAPKIAVVAIIGMVVLVFVVSLVSASIHALFGGDRVSMVEPMMGGTGMGFSKGGYDDYGGVYAEPPYADYSGEYGTDLMPSLSARNAAGMMPMPPAYYGGTSGNTAEQFEVTDYSAYIEVGNHEGACGTLSDLKREDYVIFENASESDTGCSYTFKVEHAHVDEILAALKSLNPKDLSTNTYTLKSELDDFTSQTEILETKAASVDKTLKEALAAYDEIAKLASKTQDAESLARTIESRMQLIERLTMERVQINEQLKMLARSEADEMDRLQYARFNVSVYENAYVDFSGIKDSWRYAIQDFFLIVNESLQNATIYLLAALFVLIPYVFGFILLLLAAKYGWRGVRYLWKK